MRRKPTYQELEQRIRLFEKAESERLNSDAILKLNYERLEEACRIGKIGWWEFDAVTGEGIWTDEVARIHDVDPAMPVSKDSGLQYYTEGSREKITAAVKDAVEKGLSYELELELMSAKGNRKWVQTIGRPVFENGRVARVVGILRDITDKKRVIEHNEMLAEMLDEAPASIMVLGLDGRFLYANQKMFDMHLYEKDDLPGLTVRDLANAESKEVFRERINTILEKGEISFTDTHSRKDGKEIPVEVYVKKTEWEGRPAILSITTDITDRKKEEEKLRESYKRFRALIEGAPDGIFIQNEELIQYMNPALVSLLGAPRSEDFIGTPILDIVDPEYHNAVRARIQLQDKTGQSPQLMEQEFLRSDGTKVWVECTGVGLYYKGEKARVIFVRDISLRKKAEAEREELHSRLQQAQKLDSIGQLAGGVAHDYNNMLSVIMGYTDMALDKVKSGELIHSHLLKIKAAAERSENITRQLLAFARRQTIAPKFINLNQMVDSMLKMLHRLIGENIELLWLPKKDLCPVKMDSSQVDQIIVNLCINARDAIIDSGKITIETEMVVFDESYCSTHAECLPGEFVCLIVSDNGSGMDRDTVNKIFEPFFTTKGLGHGTGLGLATVYGIIKQNNGFINVYSEPGKGTSFKVYLPCHRKQTAEDKVRKSGTLSMGKGEWILVVEDDAVFLELIQNMLKDSGYNPLATISPTEAVHLAESHCDIVALLLTDVVMPEMTGRELAKKVNKYCPAAKVIFTSGYTANVIAHQGVLEEGINFLQKPFSKADLALKIREVLDETEQEKGHS